MICALPVVKTLRVPAGTTAEPFCCIHISDLHLHPKTDPRIVAQTVALINAQNPDCIALTGDIIDKRVHKVAFLLDILTDLHAPVYFVGGNHDLVYGRDTLVAYLQSKGWICVEDTTKQLCYNNAVIEITGIKDRFSPLFGHRRKNAAFKNKEAVLKLFLAHQPKDFPLAQKAGADLFLCGHTHAGQIYPFHLAVALTQPFLSGLHRRAKMFIHVSNGVGTWGIHRRYKAQAQITKLLIGCRDENFAH